MASENIINDRRHGNLLELFQTAVLAFSVSGLCYYSYYLLAPWIWSRNIAYRPESITPWILMHTAEHDGIEIYSLYILMFVNIIITATLSWLIWSSTEKRTQHSLLVLCVIISCIFCTTIGFTPPMNTLQKTPLIEIILVSLFFMAVIYSLVAILYHLQQLSSRGLTIAVALALAPVCFIATSPITWDDYTYIFAPALQLLKGTAIHDIYFQYDLLPSLLATIWMKLGLNLNTFQVLGQAAYYVSILGTYLLSRKLFQKKELAFFLVIALILGRIYASPRDVVCYFQVTPLRIDLWLPLLVVIYFLGPYHWLVGLICGLLILLIKNFGIIYSLAYIQLLITLFGVSYFDRNRKVSLWQSMLVYGKHCWLPLIIIASFVTASHILFRNSEFGNYSGYYKKLSIGFLHISPNSFYWYAPVLFSMVIVLLLRTRLSVSPTYLATGLMLTYCAIGNSIYFFGRSHEHNILNIAIVLLFLLFFLLDLISRFLSESAENGVLISLRRSNGIIVVAAVILSVMVVFYTGNILDKIGTQFINVRKGQLIYPHDYTENPLLCDINAIRNVTHNSSRVYFVSSFDFDCYYYGGYTPIGYCNPFKTWIFSSELSRFLQGMLDNGYYLVCSTEMKYLLADLHYNYDASAGSAIVVAKQNNPIPKP